MANKNKFMVALAGSLILLSTPGVKAASYVMIGDFNANKVVKVDDETGQFMGVIAQGGELSKPLGIAYGPDNLLYVASYGTGQIKRYDANGNFVDNFVTTPKPHGIAFIGSDLIVSNHSVGTISRFGLLNWVSTPRPRLYHSVVTRDGRLFASFSSTTGGGIEEFHPFTGTSLGDFVPTSRGLVDVQGYAWGTDGKVYVTSSANSKLFKFDGNTGAPSGSINLSGGEPMGIRFSGSGDVIATSWAQSAVVKYSPSTARLISSLIPGNTTMMQPWYLERVSPTVESRIIFNDFIGATSPINSVTVNYYKSDSSELIQTFTVPVRSNGRFDVSSPQFLAPYRISIQFGTFLSNQEFIDTRDASRSTPVFSMINGDVDGSNVIDSNDYQIMSASFNSVQGEATWDPRADLNGDGFVGFDDFDILNRNWAITGEV